VEAEIKKKKKVKIEVEDGVYVLYKQNSDNMLPQEV